MLPSPQTSSSLRALPIKGEKKKTSLDPFKYENTHYYTDFYKIPLLNTSCPALAKWEDYR